MKDLPQDYAHKLIEMLLSNTTLANILNSFVAQYSGYYASVVEDGKEYQFQSSCIIVVASIVENAVHFSVKDDEYIKPIIIKQSDNFDETLTLINNAILTIKHTATAHYRKKAKEIIKKYGLTVKDVMLIQHFNY